MARPDRYWLPGLFLIGVWLITFGFAEVLRYAREPDWRDQRRHGRH